MGFEKRQPWNAFPLAALSIRKLHPDITPCASDILRYLAARSNWMGEVWVGQRRIAEDIGRSKDYVTRGVAELQTIGLITTIARGRKNLKADKSVISPSILAPEYQEIVAKATKCNPDSQEDITDEILTSRITNGKCNPDLEECNPDEQDFISGCNPDFGKCNPDYQDEALQFEPCSSDQPNLAEENLKVKSSQSISQSVSEASASPQPRVARTTEQDTVLTKEEQSPDGMDEEQRLLLETYRLKGYPMLGSYAVDSSIVTHFYELAGADRARSSRKEWKDLLAAWALLTEHRLDEVLFVMRMVLTGKIPFYRGKRRPWDFHWFAKHYPHARVLAEETFLAMEVAKDETATADNIDAPWTYEMGGWKGILDSWNGDWLTCLHELEPGSPAYLAHGIAACYLCGCPKDWKPKSKGLDTPPASGAPPTVPIPLQLCPHGNAGECADCDEAERIRNQCQHGNPSATCYQCSHPPNADCRWRECGKRFHSKSILDRFCSTECEDKFKAREQEMMAKYAKPEPKLRLAAFLDGQY